ncbi:D-isomer specific 2-hydroxyacid dehydrogenase family protein [Corynebacterium halotolerans]|uniref:Phosphoglycerate dehydrogenase-related dehydrogenase n=1 Tax=Corynebacterium halotolerans YIM 70093 = DSM 44683 TaxID=1121362 RepID=M1P082_9CORY|nr:D-isomer specific 2-hydroxyacid dehydrogenase family protein [Corynebacterium halotolerans]AGF73185.1 phosphoglycerate dehydrogenase-related dehydrogenase [Corynebacterium halotolerans YIM 70093 = DSM 44683]
MKFAFLPTEWPESIAEIEEAGHEHVTDLGQADFLVFNGGAGAFPDPLPDNIRYVQATFAGVDALRDAGSLKPGEVRWANASGLYDDTVAESTIALLLAQLHMHKTATLAGSFSVRGKMDEGKDWLFQNKTVAIIGAGGIGVRLIEMLRGFNVRTIAVNRSGRQVAGADETHRLSEAGHVWGEADYFVLLMPLTDETRRMVNADVFAKMKDTAVVVNVGRGQLIDTDDLVRALADGTIAGAALDVTDPEPLPDGHPLWELENCVITPHVANTSGAIRERAGRLTVVNAAAFAAGERMPNEVDLEAGY